jgi:hypothetical protein
LLCYSNYIDNAPESTMTSLATKTVITTTSHGHAWLRVRSIAMPDVFVGDCFRDKFQAKAAVKKYTEMCREAIRAETLRLNANASEAPTFTD